MRLLILIVFATPLWAQQTDLMWLKSIYDGARPGSVSQLNSASNSVYVLSVLVPAVSVGYTYATNRAQTVHVAVGAAAALSATAAMTWGAKGIIRRPRPAISYPQFIQPGIQESGWSMPSGHTAMAFQTATWATMNYPRWYVAVPAYGWAVFIGYSRMRLGVHYPSDVFIGAVAGSLSAWATWQINKRCFKPHRKQL
jgi:undecaprenyl-diphosphatase